MGMKFTDTKLEFQQIFTLFLRQNNGSWIPVLVTLGSGFTQMSTPELHQNIDSWIPRLVYQVLVLNKCLRQNYGFLDSIFSDSRLQSLTNVYVRVMVLGFHSTRPLNSCTERSMFSVS